MISSSLTPYPPCQIRAELHKAKNDEIWDDPLYRALQTAFLIKNPICYKCGKPSQVAHHTRQEVYGEPEYYDLDRHAIPLCYPCHEVVHGKKEPCPICGGLMQPGREKCYTCLTDEEQTAIKIKKRRLQRAVNENNRRRYRAQKRAKQTR